MGVGGVLAILGAVLPWARITTGPLLGRLGESLAGTSTGDGKAALIIGIVLLVAAAVMFFVPSRSLMVGLGIVAIVGGLVVAALTIRDISQKSTVDTEFFAGFRRGFEQSSGQHLTDDQIRRVLERFGIKVSLGAGIYVAMIGGLVGIGAGIVAALTQPPQPAPATLDSGFVTAAPPYPQAQGPTVPSAPLPPLPPPVPAVAPPPPEPAPPPPHEDSDPANPGP